MDSNSENILEQKNIFSGTKTSVAKGVEKQQITVHTVQTRHKFRCASFDCEWNPEGEIVCMCVIGSDNQAQQLHIEHFGGNQESFIKYCLEALAPYPLIFGYTIKNFKKHGEWVNSDIAHLRDNAKEAGLLPEFTKLEGRFVDCWNIFNNLNIKSALAEQGITYREKSLDSVASAILGVGQGKVQGVKGRDAWELSPSECIEYCKRDAEIPLKLMARNDWEVLCLLWDISQDVNLDFITAANATGPARWWSADFKHAGITNPKNDMTEWVNARIKTTESGDRTRPKYNGAIVLPAKPGRHNNILGFDFESMYPSQIVKHNLDPLTFLCPHEDCKANNKIPQDVMDSINQGCEQRPVHYWICKEPGYLPDRMGDLIKQKSELKKKGNKSGAMSKKTLINSCYGVFANVYFSHLNLGIAETITAFARQTLYQVKDMVEKLGIEVIYGDTDSLFLDTKDSNLSPDDIVNVVNTKFQVNLELKTKWKTIQFGKKQDGAGKQKCYIGVTYSGEVESKTFVGEKVDRPKFFVDTVEHLKSKQMLEGSLDNVVSYIESRLAILIQQSSLSHFVEKELAFHKKSNKPLSGVTETGWEKDIFQELCNKYGIEGAKSVCEESKVYTVWKVRHDKKRKSKFSLNPDPMYIDAVGYRSDFWTSVRDFCVGLDDTSEIALSELFQSQKNGAKTTAQCHLSFEGIVGTADLMRQGNKREDLDFLVIELKDTNSLKRLDFSDIVFCGYVYQLLYYLCISDVERGLLVIKYNTYEMEQIGHDAQGDLYLKRTGAKGPELCCFEVILTLDDPVRDKLKDQMLSIRDNFRKALETGDVSSLPRLIGELKKMRCFNCDFLTRCWKKDGETADAKKLNDIDDLSDLISQPIGCD
jgi:DNA polymerase elongation subunit (family B)